MRYAAAASASPSLHRAPSVAAVAPVLNGDSKYLAQKVLGSLSSARVLEFFFNEPSTPKGRYN